MKWISKQIQLIQHKHLYTDIYKCHTLRFIFKFTSFSQQVTTLATTLLSKLVKLNIKNFTKKNYYYYPKSSKTKI